MSEQRLDPTKEARDALQVAVRDYGADVLGNPELLNNLFKDSLADAPRESLSYPVYVYLSGEGRLFVPDMDEAAFPPIAPDPWAVRAVRRAAQLMFGTRPMKASAPLAAVPADDAAVPAPLGTLPAAAAPRSPGRGC